MLLEDAIRLPPAPPLGTTVPRPVIYPEIGRILRVHERVLEPVPETEARLGGVGTVDDHIFFGKVATPGGGLTIRKI